MNKKGLTLIELLVTMFMTLLVASAAYSFYIFFVNNAARERIKANIQQQVEGVFDVLSDDVRHAGFDLLKSSPSGKDICLYYVDDNCSVGGQTFCISGSDRFFVADGWRIIRDFTKDNCPDGSIDSAVYESIVGMEYAAKVNYYFPPNEIDVDRLNIDSKCRSAATMCGDGSCNDIRDNKAIIVCGCRDLAGNYGQEGKRVGNLDTATNRILFVSKESPLHYSVCLPYGRVVPANVWYIRKGNDGLYWLYRNQQKVMPNVVFFQVEVGYDLNNDGIIEKNEYLSTIPANANIGKLKFFHFKIGVQYEWKDKQYIVYFSTDVETFH